MILIGDPKQAIYAFRGGDIVTYLQAAETRGRAKDIGHQLALRCRARSSGCRWCCVARSSVTPRSWWTTWRRTTRVTASLVRRTTIRFGYAWCGERRWGAADLPTCPSTSCGSTSAPTSPRDIGALLASDATFDGKPLRARDIAVIVEKHKDAAACFKALCDAGIPAVYTGDSDVFTSDAAEDWLCLLEAFDQPHRPGMVRAAAATMFFGETAESLAAGGDELTDRVAETLREWAGHARERGVAAIFEAAQLGGMSDRLLSAHGGERHMTDLAHVTQMLQEVAHREHYSLPALRDWLRRQRDERSGATERNRRLDSDAAAVQIMTVYVSKGLQYPIVYLPFAFNRNTQERDVVLFHDDNDVRCLYIGGKDGPNFRAIQAKGRTEDASDDSRLTYVAMTRAQSQVVAWWSPARDEPNGGLSRLLRGRRPGESLVPQRVCAGQDLGRRRDGPVARMGGRGRAGDRGLGDRSGPGGAAAVGADQPRQPPLSSHHRHLVAAHVLLRPDPGCGVGRREQ